MPHSGWNELGDKRLKTRTNDQVANDQDHKPTTKDQ